MSYYLEILEPCSEDWNKMTPVNTNIRNCSSCQKNIVDFSTKTDLEIIDWIKQHPNQSICGRFREDQLERPLIEPLPAKKKGILLRWVASLLMFVSLSTLRGQSDSIAAPKQEQNDSSRLNKKIKIIPAGTLLSFCLKPNGRKTSLSTLRGLAVSDISDSNNILEPDENGIYKVTLKSDWPATEPLILIEGLKTESVLLVFEVEDYNKLVEFRIPMREAVILRVGTILHKKWEDHPVRDELLMKVKWY